MSSFSLAATYRNTGAWTVTGDLSLSIFPKNTSYAIVTGDIVGNIYFRNTGSAVISGVMGTVASGPFANYGGAAVALNIAFSQKGFAAFSGSIGSNNVSGVVAYKRQTGQITISGDVPVGFNPASLGNLVFWLDATKVVGTNGQPVNQVVDQSSTGAVANPTTTQRPTYTANNANGLPTLTFNGSSNYLNFGDVLNITAGFTTFVIFKFNGAGANYEIFSRSDGTASSQYEYRRNSTTNNTLLQSDVGASVQSRNETGTYTITNFNQVTALLDPAVGCKFWDNGSANGTPAFSPTGTMNAQAAEKLLVGARKASAPNLFAAMDLAELLIYQTVSLSTAQRQQVESYLKTKWGTP